MTAPSEAVQEAFSRFWAAYPKRPENPRKPALAAFAKAVAEGQDPEALVRAAAAYAAFCARAGKPAQFVPHARTWLAQARYEEFQEAERTDVPAGNGHGAHSQPEHPLAWLQAEIGEAAWRSWIAPLRLDFDVEPPAVLARTKLALDHVRRHYGARLSARYGELDFGLQPKEAS